MYSDIITNLLTLDKQHYCNYNPLKEVLVISNETHEITITPELFTLSEVSFTANVMDRAMSLPLTKTSLVIIHHDMFLNQTTWDECCNVTRDELVSVLEVYKKFG